MARKIKMPNERKKRFGRREQKRVQNIRTKRVYYLILCEGQATEPNYFEGLKRDLPRGVLTAYQIDIKGTGYNTLSLVNEALRMKNMYENNNNRKVDRLWVLFDKDSFPPNDFNQAILHCAQSKPVIGCAWSNEAFELWYLLHFDYYQNAMSRSQYQRLIENKLRPHLGAGYTYKKNDEEMYFRLKEYGSIEAAIRNAKQLTASYSGRQDFASHNPCTRVWELVQELLQLQLKGS